jgi:hypothetical protein
LEAGMEKKKKKKGLIKRARKKVGRGIKKISKVASKTAKTVDTFAGAGKDHTLRPIPTTTTTASSKSVPSSLSLSITATASTSSTGNESNTGIDTSAECGDEITSKEINEIIDDSASSNIPTIHPAVSCEDGNEETRKQNKNIKVPTKEWTDTDVLHHGLESNQIPGYTRALSYQVSVYI